MTWGPWASGLDPLETKARIRTLRIAVRIIAGPHGEDCLRALLVALVDPDAETLAQASAAFERLPALIRRRTLSAYLAELNEGACQT